MLIIRHVDVVVPYLNRRGLNPKIEHMALRYILWEVIIQTVGRVHKCKKRFNNGIFRGLTEMYKWLLYCKLLSMYLFKLFFKFSLPVGNLDYFSCYNQSWPADGRICGLLCSTQICSNFSLPPWNRSGSDLLSLPQTRTGVNPDGFVMSH